MLLATRKKQQMILKHVNTIGMKYKIGFTIKDANRNKTRINGKLSEMLPIISSIDQNCNLSRVKKNFTEFIEC